MATRNLTRKFLELREAVVSHRSPPSPKSDLDLRLVEDTDHVSMLPVWVDIVQSLNAEIALVKSKMADLSRMHVDRLRVSFESESEERSRDQEIELLTQQITAGFHQCEAKLKQIASVANDFVPSGSTAGSSSLSFQERQVRFNVMRAHASRIQELSKQFRQQQKYFLKQWQAGQQRHATYFPDDQVLSVDALTEAADRGTLSFEQQAQLNRASQSADEREVEIAMIARSMNDLAQLFRDINVLVIQQGSVLDRIDYNIETTLVQVREGNKQLVKAEDYQKRTHTLACIAILFVIALILTVILVFRIKALFISDSTPP